MRERRSIHDGTAPISATGSVATPAKPIFGSTGRRKLGVKNELLLAMLPTAVVLIVLMIVKVLSDQRVLFASLASSAYSIYLSPENRSNSIRCLVSSQLAAAVAGIGFDALLGANYYAAGLSMVSTVAVTIAADVFHPPATATALSFAFRSNKITSLRLFVLCLVMVAILIGLQRATLKAVARLSCRRPEMASRADTR